MKVNSFKAKSWLHDAPVPLPEKTQKRLVPHIFFPPDFLTPGWSGDGLFSKSAANIRNIVRVLHRDALEQFQSFYSLNKSLKLTVYNEFLSYMKLKDLNCHELENYQNFWHHLSFEKSPYKDILDEFTKIYCFQAVSVYLYKIRFIIHLSNSLSASLTQNNLMGPVSFLNKLFKKGSSTELICESLQPNPYSWYSPSSALKETIYELRPGLSSISISEMMRICTYQPSKGNFPHALSHKVFGIFLHQLLTDLPRWINNDNPSQAETFINCKFLGDHLTSLSLSHWLARKALSEERPDERPGERTEHCLCPSFISEQFNEGFCVKICHEIQFMTALTQDSQKSEKDPITTISRMMKKKYLSSPEESNGQISMFCQSEIKYGLTYDRIVMALVNLPKISKGNPHHYLITQINQQKKYLRRNGILYVFTNQNLFLPSQSNRIEQLLQTFKLEVHLNLERLKGKGEIPSYLYVFTHRKRETFSNLHTHPDTHQYYNRTKKESCAYFQWYGELSCFQKFATLTDELENFLNRKNSMNIPLYQKEVGDHLIFSFQQDAILEGKILNSTSCDSSHITHPSFFKNLTQSCIPFDQFFYLRPLNHAPTHDLKQKRDLSFDLLGIKVKEEERYPLILIVDYTNPTHINLELTTAKSYKAKCKKYGHVVFQYFGLIPKHPDLNSNAFREFFETDIGSQIIQLSLGDRPTKLKSKLKSLLIPKFLLITKTMPFHIEDALSFFKSNARELLKTHPDNLLEQFEETEKRLADTNIAKEYPWHTIGLLAQFKSMVEECLGKLEFGKKHSQYPDPIDYCNPLLIESLLKIQTIPILPQHPDIFIDFKVEKPDQLNVFMSGIEQKTSEDNHFLEIFSDDGRAILNIYSTLQMLQFIRYLLNSAKDDMSIKSILQQLSIPRQKDLAKVIEKFKAMEESLHCLHRHTKETISHIMAQQISSS